ncbi:MAG: DUF4091 domain-containing protein [Planctomycetes bacterium]|nr:DUF4091 domain-containing protein [Planctomycetota bacterium]
MKTQSWLTDSLHRLQANGPAGRSMAAPIPAARGERISCQVAVRAGRGEAPESAHISCRAPAGLKVRIRRMGYVPVPRHTFGTDGRHLEGNLPGYVGDPLLDEDTVELVPRQTQVFWLTVQVARSCRAGLRKIHITVDAPDKSHRHELAVRVYPLTIKPRKNFPVTHWFYTDALCDFHAVKPFSKRFWPVLEAYVRDVVQHGQDTLYVPLLTPPVNGIKRPTQLVKIRRTAPDKYSFGFADARKWILLAKRCGVRYFEINHLFSQWGAARAVRAYHGQGLDERALWGEKTPATGRTYRTFLEQYLPALERFLRKEGILRRCFFHVSDEPKDGRRQGGYGRARALLADLAPWMKIMEALSDIDFARLGLVDVPIPSIRTTAQFLSEGIDCWTYFCCGPRGKYLNRFMDTPLSKIRMAGWLFYRTGVRGFLHWGYNYWYKANTREKIDPFVTSDAATGGRWPCGDPFLVYPGDDGRPIDSIRWEVFADSLQDYALLATLGVDRGDKLLAGIRAYDDFPFSPTWTAAARTKLLERSV